MSYSNVLGALRRWCGWLILFVLVFMAVYVSLGQILLANISGFRNDILSFARDNYQLHISLGEVRGVWRGLSPRVYISDLAIGDEGADQTRFDAMEIELDPLQSLLKGSWVVSHFYASGLETSIQLLSTGEFQIAGIPFRESTSDPDLLVDLLVYTRLFTLAGIKIRLSTEYGTYSINQRSIRPFELVSQQDLKTISLLLDWKRKDKSGLLEQDGTIQFIGEYAGDPRQRDSFYSKFYLKITPIQLHDVIPDYAYREIRLSKFMFGGEFWATLDKGELDLVAAFNVPELELISTGKPVRVARQFTGRFRLQGSDLWDWRAQLDQLNFVRDEEKRSIADLQLIAFSDQEIRRLVASLGDHELSNLSSLILKLGDQALPEKAYSIIESMNPRGKLAETYLDFKLVEDQPDFRLMARIEGGKLSAYLGSPMIDNLDALVSVGPRDLWIDVHNNPYQMRFASIFDDVWSFDSAAGRVKIGYQPGRVTIGSDLLTVTKAGMKVNGKFHLNLESDPIKQTWGLILGITQGDASEKSPFLPNNLSATLHQWLDSAILGGQVVDGGLLFHGSVAADAPGVEKLHEYYFRVADGVLDYHPDWPQLSNIQAVVNGGNWGVASNDAVATVQEASLTADVIVPFNATGQSSFVNTKGVYSGESQALLDFIKNSPVAQMTNHLSDEWLAEGLIQGDFDLAIPINNAMDPDGLPLYQFDGTIMGRLHSVQLKLPTYNLVLENIETDLFYTPTAGINAEQFSAALFGFPVKGQLHTTYQKNRQAGIVQLDFTGSTDIDAIRNWSGIPFLAIASGESDFNASLVAPFGPNPDRPYFVADSNLVGVGVELPEPLAKNADDALALQYKVVFWPEFLDMQLEFGEQVKTDLVLEAGKLKSGLIAINEELSGELPEAGLRISGFIDHIDYADWVEFNERLASIHEASTGLSYSDQLGSLINQISVRTTDFQFKEVNLPDLALVANRAAGLWTVAMENKQLAGSISFFDDENIPILLDLDYLRLSTDQKDQPSDPLAEVSPDSLLPARVKVSEFTVNEENYGSWQFDLRPHASHVQVTDLFAAVKGLHVQGDGEAGATLDWIASDTDRISVFNGKITVPDMSEALTEWGLAPSIEGEKFSFNAAINWHGSPAMIARDTIDGRVSVDSDRGRFVQASGGGAMKLLGIFDFASLARRFRFDFSDVATEGYEFNSIDGEWRTDHGMISVTKPITIKGASSSFKIGGEANIMTGDINGDMIVTLPVSRNLPWYSALVVGPVIGAGVYLVQKVFEDQIDQFSSAKYEVTGTIDEPVIEFVGIFNNTVREDLTQDISVEVPAASQAPDGEGNHQ